MTKKWGNAPFLKLKGNHPYTMQKMNMITADTFKTIHQLHDIIKERGQPDEITADALVWITRLSWAVEDCYEDTTKQLIDNCDDAVQKSFLQLLHTLLAEINTIIQRCQSHRHIPRSLILGATTRIASIHLSFYHD